MTNYCEFSGFKQPRTRRHSVVSVSILLDQYNRLSICSVFPKMVKKIFGFLLLTQTEKKCQKKASSKAQPKSSFEIFLCYSVGRIVKVFAEKKNKKLLLKRGTFRTKSVYSVSLLTVNSAKETGALEALASYSTSTLNTYPVHQLKYTSVLQDVKYYKNRTFTNLTPTDIIIIIIVLPCTSHSNDIINGTLEWRLIRRHRVHLSETRRNYAE